LPAAQGPLDLRVLDSTFLRVALSLAPWLPPGVGTDQVSGVRVQVIYTPALDLPTHCLITDSCTNDCQGLDQAVLDDPVQLAALAGQTLVVDLGYYAHARLARLLQAGVHVVIRLHPQASLRVLAELPVQTSWDGAADGGRRISVQSDQRVQVGSPHNRSGAVLRGLRLVTALVAPTARAAAQGAAPVLYRVLTDRWEVPAEQVIQWYLWRWQIELFFRWLKSHVYLGRLLGYSDNAVQLTVWLAILVHLLLVLAAQVLGQGRRSPILRAQLSTAVSQLAAPEGGGPPGRPPIQLVLPGLAATLGGQD
jgi:putative transposase